MADDWKAALGALAASMPDSGVEPEAEPASEPAGPLTVDKRKLRIDFERKGRAGKCATIISGFDCLSNSEIADIASQLKRRLACGGSTRGGEILIQGDRRDDIKKYFGLK